MDTDDDAVDAWLVRVVMSMLMLPAAPEDTDGGAAVETNLLRRFLVPALIPDRRGDGEGAL